MFLIVFLLKSNKTPSKPFILASIFLFVIKEGIYFNSLCQYQRNSRKFVCRALCMQLQLSGHYVKLFQVHMYAIPNCHVFSQHKCHEVCRGEKREYKKVGENNSQSVKDKKTNGSLSLTLKIEKERTC